MSDFHIVVFFNDYYTLIIAFLTKQIQNRYRYRCLPDSPNHPLSDSLYFIVNTSERGGGGVWWEAVVMSKLNGLELGGREARARALYTGGDGAGSCTEWGWGGARALYRGHLPSPSGQNDRLTDRHDRKHYLRHNLKTR